VNGHKMRLGAAALFLSALAAPALAELPVPPQSAAPRDAQAYLFHAGAGDVFEVTTSMLLLQKSQNPQVRGFATMLIADHTMLSNTALATAKGAGVMPPPPELTPQQKAQITQLMSATPATIDRVYLQQQLPAHQQALALNQGYGAAGDTPALRQAAAAAVSKIQQHIVQVQQLLSAAR
jgi:putative membrane protein